MACTRRRKIAIACALLSVAVLLVIVAPRQSNLRRYRSVCSDEASRACLEAVPVRIDLSGAESDGDLFETEYSQFALPEGFALALKTEAGSYVFELDDAAVTLMPPWPVPEAGDEGRDVGMQRSTRALFEESTDQAHRSVAVENVSLADSSFQELLRSRIGRPGRFETHLAIANVRPKSSWEVLCMPSSEFERYFVMATLKATNIFNANGIGVFETSRIKGLIHQGIAHEVGVLFAEVWSLDGDIARGIFIRSSDSVQGDRLMRGILASYEFTVDELPK